MSKRVFTQTFVAVGAILEHKGKILLVKENMPGRPDHGKWNQPAGWIEVDEDPIASVIKEVREETGLKFKPTGILGIYSLIKQDQKIAPGNMPHVIKIMFVGKFSGKLITKNDEISELRWFRPSEIDKMSKTVLRDPDIKQEVKDYFKKIKYSLKIFKHTTQK